MLCNIELLLLLLFLSFGCTDTPLLHFVGSAKTVGKPSSPFYLLRHPDLNIVWTNQSDSLPLWLESRHLNSHSHSKLYHSKWPSFSGRSWPGGPIMALNFFDVFLLVNSFYFFSSFSLSFKIFYNLLWPPFYAAGAPGSQIWQVNFHLNETDLKKKSKFKRSFQESQKICKKLKDLLQSLLLCKYNVERFP